MAVDRDSWLTLFIDAMRLCVEAGDVVSMRLQAALWGKMDVRGETWRMIAEKGEVAWEAHLVVAESLIAGQGHLAPARAVAVYRRRVQDNQQRLSHAGGEDLMA